MSYKTDAFSFIGVKKKVNQDALIIKQAKTADGGNVCMACLCDGMGGLSQGEVASAAFVKRMDEWFKNELPRVLSTSDITEDLTLEADAYSHYWGQIKAQWQGIIQKTNERLMRYGRDRGIELGTTVVAIVIINDEYMVMNVGDSRAYELDERRIKLLTHDHSYVQREMDLGNMTLEEAQNSNKKSLRLQCVGASEVVIPDFYQGYANAPHKFLLCSDGFWRKLEEDEMVEVCKQQNGLEKLTDAVVARGETDNISSLLISV